MTLLSLITTTGRWSLELVERAYTRQQLLNLDERTLADLGINRELLEQGIKAFPWKILDASPEAIYWSNTSVPSPNARVKLSASTPAQDKSITLNPSYV